MDDVDRMALIVRPRQPYIDWANAFDDGGPKFDPAAHRPRVYLIDEIADPIDLHKALRNHWRDIFEEELEGWMRDADDWPSPRTQKVFLQWFDVEVAELVTNMGQSPL